MVDEQQVADALVADAVLAGQDEGVGEQLLAAGADELPLDVLDGNLDGGRRRSTVIGPTPAYGTRLTGVTRRGLNCPQNCGVWLKGQLSLTPETITYY